MMVEPGITELDKCVDSRYTLVSMAAKRARMIGTEQAVAREGKDPKEVKDMVFDKPVSIAVEEIAHGKVGYVRSEGVARAELYEEEKLAAIQMAEQGETPENDVVFGEEIAEVEFCDEVE